MVFKLIVVLGLGLIVGSLVSGLVFLYRDRGGGTRVVKMLTVRITLSVLLFVGLLAVSRYNQ